MSELGQLRLIMRSLRDPDRGCPWDRAQNWRSIVPHTLEEAYEVAEAIETADFGALPAELGDLLFQIVFYCQLGEEEGRFSLDDVVAALEQKLVSRHPHVFGDAGAESADVVAQAWESRKAAQRIAAGQHSELDDVPAALPGLSRATKIQKRAARVGFDWPDHRGAWRKVDEELLELRHAHSELGADAVHDELGDVLFAVVNVARHLGVEPESSLRHATAKFERRFRAVESRVTERNLAMTEASAALLDQFWEEAKSAEKQNGG